MSETPLCVYCRQRPVDPTWRPFCSERCKLADLGRWLQGDYRVPGAQDSPRDPDDAGEE
jgi:endogenous inhibitor of DNA gyrase (YacG/DUF329 family)